MKKYCIIPKAQTTAKMVNYSLAKNLEGLRTSNDGNYYLFIFDFDDNKSREAFENYLWKDRVEILEILNFDSNWRPPEK